MIEHVSEELDLTETQRSSLETLKDTMLKVKREMHPESETKADRHAQIREMITADQFDQSKMIDLINRKAEIVQQNSSEVVAALGAFLDGLDQDQKNELASKLGKKRGWGKRHGRHRHGHDDDHGRGHGYDDERSYDSDSDDRGDDPRWSQHDTSHTLISPGRRCRRPGLLVDIYFQDTMAKWW